MEHISLHHEQAFPGVYRALRVQLCDLQIKMLNTEFPSANAAALLDKLSETLQTCEQRTRHEDQYILPRLQRTAAAMMADLEEDHAQEEDLMARLRYLVKRWRQTESPQDAEAMLFGLSDFTAFKLSHLNREERELMPILRQHFSDEELQGMAQEVTAVHNYCV